MYTNVSVFLTEITYADMDTNEVVVYEVGGKKTVKECKQLIPENAIFVQKETRKEKFDVITNELLKLKL